MQQLVRLINEFVTSFQQTNHEESSEINAILLTDLFNFLTFQSASDGCIDEREINILRELTKDEMIDAEIGQFTVMPKEQRQQFLSEPPLTLVLACSVSQDMAQQALRIFGLSADILNAADTNRSLAEEQDRAEYLYMLKKFCDERIRMA